MKTAPNFSAAALAPPMSLSVRFPIAFLPAALLVALSAGSAPALAQPSIVDQFEVRAHTHDGFTLPYRLFVPDGYDPGVAYPLVLALHGAGERGTDNERQLTANRLATTWADPVNQAEHPAFVVAPQVPPNLRWSAEQPVDHSDLTAVQRTVLALLDSLEAEFNVDPDRLYITGLSMGGHGTWDFASRLPRRFAAAVPMSGRADPTQAEHILHLPIWAFHGETDTVVEPAGSRRIVQAMEDLGRDVLYTDCRRSPPLATNFDCPGSISPDSLADAIEAHADLLLTSLPNVGHGPWSPWYDRPLLHEWLFAQHRRDPDAVTLSTPVVGTTWSGSQSVTWTGPGPGSDVVELWLSLDDGARWSEVGEAPLGAGAFEIDTAALPDAAFARFRLVVRDARGFVYGRTTSAPFAIDNGGDAPPFLALDGEPLRFDPLVTAPILTLNVRAADPEGEELNVEVFYSLDGGATYAQAAALDLPSRQETQTLTLDIGRLPNAAEARLRIEVSDGTHVVSAATTVFEKDTPRETLAAAEQVAGEGVGSVTVHVVEPDALTGHRYRVAIDASDPAAKTFSVTDLTVGEPLLSRIPLSDGLRESPVFDGVALVVEDLDEGRPDLEATGWTAGDTDLGVAIAGGTIRISILTVRLLATEVDYDLTIASEIVATSVARYAIPAQELRFAVTGVEDGLPRELVFADANDDGLPGDGDVLYLLEPDDDGELEPAWRFTFEEGAEPPEPGDTFRFVPLRSLGSTDAFEFVAAPVNAEGSPEGLALSLSGYPNPFTDRASIVYRVGAPSAVTLEVFDVLGRRVAVLATGPHESGEHRIDWRGTARIASGLHTLRLTARPLGGGPPQVARLSLVRLR